MSKKNVLLKEGGCYREVKYKVNQNFAEYKMLPL